MEILALIYERIVKHKSVGWMNLCIHLVTAMAVAFARAVHGVEQHRPRAHGVSSTGLASAKATAANNAVIATVESGPFVLKPFYVTFN